MRVFLTGGTGLIGRRLVQKLIERGDRPVVLSRQADKARLNPALKGAEVVQGDPTVSGGWETAVDGSDAVINLVGHNIFAERWTAEVKRKIRDSRVYGTEGVVAAISRASNRPKALVQASAIGYYGPHGDEELTESSPSGTDFLAVVCREWEDAAKAVETLGTRLATIRVGVVLSREGGALKVLTPIFKYLPGGAAPVGSAGGLLASGQQWMSWIHIDDIVGIFLMALDNAEAKGPINGTAPRPERNVDFSRALAGALRKGFWPPFLPFGPPDLVMSVVLGDVAQIVTKGQKVLPAKAQSLGYAFQFPDLESALRDLFGKSAAPNPAQPEPVAASH